jgi:adenylosuccinate lyase
MPQTVHPLKSRYSSKEMQHIFSNERKFTGWRDCWIALAEAEMELGLKQIKPEYVAAMRTTRGNIDYQRAEEIERELMHDVMAHVHAWKEQLEKICPGAGGIIHLGATSMYPCDNTELLQIKEGLELVIGKVVNVLRRMKPFAEQHASTPCLAMTHYQPAQPTTYGKRICDWMHGLVISFYRLSAEEMFSMGRGVKGTTGTQDSFMKLFEGDAEKVRKLDELVAEKLGFEDVYPITTQTYPRIVDYHVLAALAGVCVAAKKTGTDLRLLQGKNEMSEPFRKSQVGSSAMPYKRNPMRAERMCGLARHVIAAPGEAAAYASEQWLERTLDDSAERRILISDTFLGTDAVLNLMLDIFSPDTEKQNGFRIYPAVALKNLAEVMPFLVTEEVMMNAVKFGGDRQEVHEIIRQCAVQSREAIDVGEENPMIELMEQHTLLGVTSDEKNLLLDPARYIGTCRAQVEIFLGKVDEILEEHANVPEMSGNVKV